jgi:hypothetical protein
MTPWLIVVAVWAVCAAVVLVLVRRMTPPMVADWPTRRVRAVIHVDVDEGLEDVAAEQFLRADLMLAERGE